MYSERMVCDHLLYVELRHCLKTSPATLSEALRRSATLLYREALVDQTFCSSSDIESVARTYKHMALVSRRIIMHDEDHGNDKSS